MKLTARMSPNRLLFMTALSKKELQYLPIRGRLVTGVQRVMSQPISDAHGRGRGS